MSTGSAGCQKLAKEAESYWTLNFAEVEVGPKREALDESSSHPGPKPSLSLRFIDGATRQIEAYKLFM